jgi:hypothetical protein
MSDIHIHKCCVHECSTLIECDGNCVEEEAPKWMSCPEHRLMINGCLEALGTPPDGTEMHPERSI